MQFVDLAFAFGVLQFPHPLFADYLHLQGVARRPLDMEINDRAPTEEADKDHQRNNRPPALDQD